jgi:hypothetical protein
MRDRTAWVTLSEGHRTYPFPIMPTTSVLIGLFKSSASTNGSGFNAKTVLAIRLSQFVPTAVLRYMYRNSSDPRLKQMVQTNELSKRVARELVALKIKELADGVAKKDVLSLIGVLLPLPLSFTTILIANLDSQSE